MIFVSILGILTLVMFARAIGFARNPLLTDAAEARRIAEAQMPGFYGVDAAIDDNGRGARVRGSDGRTARVRGHGDRWVVEVER
ncbi:hypothetical protein [Polymorphobacter megasporae]|uniref:hypothetical protein n=1 Tax=Glacieibacterium megasporae TaxID=2835787 RepID=UPI001C1E0668|nr:hypothetical protein [Polymorphobacter megasporae]UAJ10198.1 hypothetical protein KTC28_18390 [Polymorphobacter megasporae]